MTQQGRSGTWRTLSLLQMNPSRMNYIEQSLLQRQRLQLCRAGTKQILILSQRFQQCNCCKVQSLSYTVTLLEQQGTINVFSSTNSVECFCSCNIIITNRCVVSKAMMEWLPRFQIPQTLTIRRPVPAENVVAKIPNSTKYNIQETCPSGKRPRAAPGASRRP